MKLALLISILVCLVPLTAAFAVEIVAHRGASYDAPENTLASFRLGYEQNADADELDIYLTKDGQIAVIHDADTKRTGGVEKKIVDSTLDELRQVNVGSFGKYKGKGLNEKIPTLDEVLAIVPKGKKILIEIKCKSEVLPALEQTFKRSSLGPEQTVIITFHYEVAKAAKEKFPNRSVYLLSGYGKDKKTGEFPDLDALIKKAKDAKLDGLDLEHKFPLDAAAVKKVKDAGLSLHVWTLDDPVKAKQLAQAGIDSITTNRPGYLREAMK